MDKVEMFQKFHVELFGKNRGLDFSQMRSDPAGALGSVCKVIDAPHFQTFETGFVLGLCVAHCAVENPMKMHEIFKTLEAVRKIENAKRNS